MTTKGNSTMRRIFCGLAACALLVSTAGCGNGGGDSKAGSSSGNGESSSASSNTSSGGSSSGSAPASSSTGEAVGFEPTMVPLPEEPLCKYPVEKGGKISMWVAFNGTSAKYYQSLAEDISVKQYVEDTGIEIEFVHPASGQEKENFNLLVVSGSLPDIIVNGDTHYSGGSSAAVADGVFADLTDLVAEWAPDYNYLLEKNELFWRLATTENGEVFNIYAYKDIQAPWYDRAQFRGDWLEEFGMDIPKTFADYEAYFQKVKETYPDVAPYTPEKNGIEQHFMGSFDCGTVSNGGRFFVKDGKMQHAFLQPGFKDYLTMMADWYQKGYINKDFTTIDDADKEFCNGRTGFVVGNTDGIYTLGGELGINSVTAPYPRVNEGDIYHGDIFYFPQNGTPTNISATSKNKELALQFLNYGFTKQGSAVINFGDPDTSWNWSEEPSPEYDMTIPIYTDYALNCPDYPMSDIEYTVRLHTCWAKYRYGDDIMMIRNVANPDCWAYRAKWGDDPTADNSYARPDLTFSAEVASEFGPLLTNIDTFAEEKVLKYITGAESLDTYDSFVAEVKNLGMDRVLELQQEAYDGLISKSR